MLLQHGRRTIAILPGCWSRCSCASCGGRVRQHAIWSSLLTRHTGDSLPTAPSPVGSWSVHAALLLSGHAIAMLRMLSDRFLDFGVWRDHPVLHMLLLHVPRVLLLRARRRPYRWCWAIDRVLLLLLLGPVLLMVLLVFMSRRSDRLRMLHSARRAEELLVLLRRLAGIHVVLTSMWGEGSFGASRSRRMANHARMMRPLRLRRRTRARLHRVLVHFLTYLWLLCALGGLHLPLCMHQMRRGSLGLPLLLQDTLLLRLHVLLRAFGRSGFAWPSHRALVITWMPWPAALLHLRIALLWTVGRRSGRSAWSSQGHRAWARHVLRSVLPCDAGRSALPRQLMWLRRHLTLVLQLLHMLRRHWPRCLTCHVLLGLRKWRLRGMRRLWLLMIDNLLPRHPRPCSLHVCLRRLTWLLLHVLYMLPGWSSDDRCLLQMRLPSWTRDNPDVRLRHWRASSSVH